MKYYFDKEKNLIKAEPSGNTLEKNPCNLLYIPNPVRLLLKEYTGGEEITITFDGSKAYFDKENTE